LGKENKQLTESVGIEFRDIDVERKPVCGGDCSLNETAKGIGGQYQDKLFGAMKNVIKNRV